MGVAEDLAARWITAGLITAIGTDLFLGAKANLPSKRENVGPYTSLIDTGGTGAVKSHSTRYPRPSLQVVVRAASAPVAKAKALALHANVADKYNQTLGANFYLDIEVVQEVLDMQEDEVGRARFGFNINILKTQ